MAAPFTSFHTKTNTKTYILQSWFHSQDHNMPAIRELPSTDFYLCQPNTTASYIKAAY